MRRSILVAIALLFGTLQPAEAGPKATFDLMSYEAPAGWTAGTSDGALTLTTVDAQKGTFAVVMVSPSTASAGSLPKDFEAAWQRVIVTTLGVTNKPQMSPGAAQNGWEALAGAATGSFEGTAAAVILVTMSGHGRTMSIVVATNSDTYGATIDTLLSSVEMRKPATKPPAVLTTTFDDGWTSTAEADWVRVARPGATVFLHYPVTHGDESRRDAIGYFWKKLVAPRYTIVKLYAHPRSALNFDYEFMQADAKDPSGRTVFVSLRVVSANGVARPIEVVTDSSGAFATLFPDQDKLAAIAGANRFAIGAELSGTWSGSTGASVSLVYVDTGLNAGMNAAVGSDVFTFGAKGVYASKHQGAFGRVGSMTTYSEKKKGKYTVAPWEITVKLSDGKVITYTAYYEMVRGQRVLHLQDKKYSGMAYTLVRDAR